MVARPSPLPPAPVHERTCVRCAHIIKSVGWSVNSAGCRAVQRSGHDRIAGDGPMCIDVREDGRECGADGSLWRLAPLLKRAWRRVFW